MLILAAWSRISISRTMPDTKIWWHVPNLNQFSQWCSQLDIFQQVQLPMSSTSGNPRPLNVFVAVLASLWAPQCHRGPTCGGPLVDDVPFLETRTSTVFHFEQTQQSSYLLVCCLSAASLVCQKRPWMHHVTDDERKLLFLLGALILNQQLTWF